MGWEAKRPTGVGRTGGWGRGINREHSRGRGKVGGDGNVTGQGNCWW